MHRHLVLPLGSGFEKLLKPNLRLRSSVGEKQSAGGIVDTLDDFVHHSRAEMSAPRKSIHLAGQQRLHFDPLGVLSVDELSDVRAGSQQNAHRLLEIANRRGCPPRLNGRLQMSQPSEAQLGLHAAFGAHLLMPFIDDHRAKGTELRHAPGVRQHQRETLWRGDKRERRLRFLPRADIRRGVSRSRFDRSLQPHLIERLLQLPHSVARQRSERRDPHDAQTVFVRTLHHGTEPYGEGLALPGRSVDESTRARRVGVPRRRLKRQWLPPTFLEPGDERRGEFFHDAAHAGKPASWRAYASVSISTGALSRRIALMRGNLSDRPLSWRSLA